jgi:putative ABC transport system substrate-binding protein
MMRRLLAFVLAILVVYLGWLGIASAADPQQPASPRRIGVLLVTVSLESAEAQAFRQGMRDAGYAEGRDVVIEWRSANGSVALVPELVADLVRSKVDVMVVDSTVATRAARRATSTIPIVMALVGDPVGSGLVASLANPGINLTGLSAMAPELSVKRLQLIKEVIPRLSRVGVLWDPATPWHTKAVEDLNAAARSMSIEVRFFGARMPEELGPAFSVFSRTHAQALEVLTSALSYSHRGTILELARKAQLPTIYSARQYVEEGGLMSYGANYSDLMRRSASYVDKILKGAKPGELPIEQPNKFHFAVNLKTAKALGITIPESILLRADEVIR